MLLVTPVVFEVVWIKFESEFIYSERCREPAVQPLLLSYGELRNGNPYGFLLAIYPVNAFYTRRLKLLLGRWVTDHPT